MKSELMVALLVVAFPALACASEGVVSAVKESAKDNNRISVCIQLAKANEPTTSANAGVKKEAVDQVSSKLKVGEPLMLRARGDVARKALYGYPSDLGMAMRMYERAAKSQEAGWNASLLLYQSAPDGVNPQLAQRILSLLEKSGASSFNSRGAVGAQAHYLSGLLTETGATGKVDVKKAFLHYRASARNGYIPGSYHYMRLLTQSMSKLTESERAVALHEVRMMTNRWKWHLPEIMMLTGDLHSSRWFPDAEGFTAQYHWRMAMKMATRLGGVTETSDFEATMRQRIKPLTPEMEKRLEEAVEAGMRIATTTKHNLEFADLCVD
ncbi:hypothetical protein LJR129_004998 [Acidovorax sp. LjRoot129]|uniref:hypothetical protein n=1 Tax=unclassified Acidovorax TaxID=2684926 RepID=UPI003ED056F9